MKRYCECVLVWLSTRWPHHIHTLIHMWRFSVCEFFSQCFLWFSFVWISNRSNRKKKEKKKKERDRDLDGMNFLIHGQKFFSSLSLRHRCAKVQTLWPRWKKNVTRHKVKIRNKMLIKLAESANDEGNVEYKYHTHKKPQLNHNIRTSSYQIREKREIEKIGSEKRKIGKSRERKPAKKYQVAA